MLGGIFATFEGIGAATARLTLEALEPGGGPPHPVKAPASAVVDWRQVRRFGLDGSALPPDAVILFRGVQAWERYRVQVLTASAVLLT